MKAIPQANEPEATEPSKGIRDYEQHPQNPFLEGLHLRTRGKTVALRTGKQLELTDRETGEVLDDTAFMAVRQRVDTAEFVKVFKAHLKYMFDLTPRAMKVFGYVLHAARVGDHRIVFSVPECKEFTGYASHVTIQEAIAELLEKKFLARTTLQSLYYLNPAMFFNGDRIVMIRDVVRKGSAADKRLQQHDPWEHLNQPTLETYAERQALTAGQESDDEGDGSKEESRTA